MGLSGLMKWVLEFFYSITGNYGVAIIFLTIAIRLILYPLTTSQAKSMEQMKKLQPLQKELQEKYKGKSEEYQKRVVELYKEHKVNPLGGCLPTLIQLPFMVVLFNVLRTYDFGGAGFLWLRSLSAQDPYYILPVLSGLTMYVQSKMMSTDASQATMNLIMPIFLTWISLRLPAGLVLYWVVTTLFGIGQQYIVVERLAGQGGKKSDEKRGKGGQDSGGSRRGRA